MKLYHGTNIDFTQIDINRSNPYKDFGKGFYLTDIYEQALLMANKKAKIYGGTPIVQEYEFNENVLLDHTFNVLTFNSPNKDWAEFIYKNRNRHFNYQHNYDIIIGPIANDGVAYLLGRFDEGTLSIDELAKALTYTKLNNQYFFGTTKSIKLLHRL